MVSYPDPYRLIQVHALLLKLVVVHDHSQVVRFALEVDLPQGDTEGTDALEILGFVELKFVVISLAALLELHQLVVSTGDRAGKLVVRRANLALEILAGLSQVFTGAVDLLLLL